MIRLSGSVMLARRARAARPGLLARRERGALERARGPCARRRRGGSRRPSSTRSRASAACGCACALSSAALRVLGRAPVRRAPALGVLRPARRSRSAACSRAAALVGLDHRQRRLAAAPAGRAGAPPSARRRRLARQRALGAAAPRPAVTAISLATSRRIQSRVAVAVSDASAAILVPSSATTDRSTSPACRAQPQPATNKPPAPARDRPRSARSSRDRAPSRRR